MELNWENALDVANAAVGDQIGDDRVLCTVHQLSPTAVDQQWHEVYKYACTNTRIYCIDYILFNTHLSNVYGQLTVLCLAILYCIIMY